jgi:hypothetical protein
MDLRPPVRKLLTCSAVLRLFLLFFFEFNVCFVFVPYSYFRTFRYILATTASSKMVMRCEFLKKCAFLDPLSNEQISKLAGALETIVYEDGDYIIRQGEVGDSFYVIEEGTVKCTQLKASGKEVELL